MISSFAARTLNVGRADERLGIPQPRRGLRTRPWLKLSCSLTALAAALGPAAAQGIDVPRSPSTLGLTAADFDTPEYRADYGLAQINAATAYARGFTGLGVLVAVYDSGIDANNPEFRGRISSASGNFFTGVRAGELAPGYVTPGPDFDDAHGTHVSGTIGAARNGVGMMGVAYESTNLTLYTLASDQLKVDLGGLDDAGPAAIDHATRQRAQVFNGSYGPTLSAPTDRNGARNPTYRSLSRQEYALSDMDEYNALKRAADSGMLLVFAAGNDRQSQPDVTQNPSGAALYPYIKPANAGSGVYQFYTNTGNSPDIAPTGPVDQSRIDFSGLAGSIVSVVAVDRNNRIADFSNWCGVTAAWCIAAPGVQIVSTVQVGNGPGGSNYGVMSGTSMAAPHVAGAAAVLMQAFPFLTAPQIAQTMFTTATNIGPAAIYGWGLLNLGKAIDGPGQFTTTWTVDTKGYNGRFANDIGGAGGLIKTGIGTLQLSGTNSYGGGTAINGGTLAVSTDRNLGAASGGLAFGGGTLEVLADGFSTARPITLNGPGTLQIDLGTAAFAGAVADGTGPGSLTKTGPGTAVLSAVNTYTGVTTVAAGTLALQGAGSIAASRLVSVTGTFDISGVAGAGTSVTTLAGAGQVALGARTLTVSNGSTSFDGTLFGTGGFTLAGGRLALTGTSTYSGATTVTGGSTLVASSTASLGDGSTTNALVFDRGTLLAAGRIDSPASRPVQIASAGTIDTGGNSVSIAGALGGPGALTKAGAGTLTLSGTGAHAGGTAVAAGTLALTATGSLLAPVSVAAAGTFANAGLVAASVTNAGLTTNAGTFAGGVANAGILSNTGAITGGLANVGLASNTGTIAGGVTNAGVLATAGAITGGLRNTGTVVASAGRIDGSVVNAAGTVAVAGAVAGDGGFANAAGASLNVASGGAYALGGTLDSAGTVSVAPGAALSAAAIGNAGLLVSDGALNGSVSNTGVARLSGLLTGALGNAGTALITGPLAGVTALVNDGAFDLGGGALTAASLSGGAGGAIGNGRLTVGSAAASTYAGAFVDGGSATGLTKVGSGTLTLTGTGRISGPTAVEAGTLSLNGLWTAPVTVAAAGTLRGIGTVAAPILVAGALRPGNSPGTLTVAGPVTFAPGSTLGLDIDGTGTGTGAGSYARLLAVGPTGAVAAGGTLAPALRGIAGSATNGFTPALGQRFNVLVAQAGLGGSFAGLAQPAAGLPAATRFDALYAADGLDLVVTPAAYGNLAAVGLPQSGNARAVGAAVDLARPAAGTRPDAARARVYDALYTAPPAFLGAGLASLSGQTYGDAVMADLAARRLVADTIDRHLTGGGGAMVGLSAGDPGIGPNRTAIELRARPGAAPSAPALAIGEGRIWADALYGRGDRAGDRAAAGAGFDAGGLLLGVDRSVGPSTLVGAAFSYLRTDGSSRGTGGSFGLGRFAADSYGGTLYASTRLGDVVLRGQAGGSYVDARIDRTVALGGSPARASGAPTGGDLGVSGFAGYALRTGLPVDVIPEVGFSYDRLIRRRADERNSLVAQSFATADLDAARTLVGGRVAGLGAFGVDGLRVDARAYWAHELADTAAVVRSALFGAPFASRTSALARDGAVIGLNVGGAVAAGTYLSLAYSAELRPGATAQIISAGLQAAW
ncbi:S8 family serine peptidase [Methylobacterium sp. NEAU 140]|uniref:S8 family serine peptidase n=1 Tax=Methylobacterium sp. NEAU 140 TaxID=3064945 RepID=UPI002732D0F9|nr:S8 family serine peptidase [Methylobacterium sp. NEAU 140]MDP4025364.1 S8 family serine peptidase [Methylobacterium sp. NEAU 140]